VLIAKHEWTEWDLLDALFLYPNGHRGGHKFLRSAACCMRDSSRIAYGFDGFMNLSPAAFAEARCGQDSSLLHAVMDVHHAAAETALVQQFELQTDIAGDGPFAASHQDRDEEQAALVDQPCLERVGG
jgi:hypothetical protein